MNGKFDEKKILKEIRENHIKVKGLIKEAVKEADKILSGVVPVSYESYPLAVVTLAEMIFKIELQTVQAKAKIELVATQMKARKAATAKAEKEFPPQGLNR